MPHVSVGKRKLDTLALRKRAERSEDDAELSGRIASLNEKKARGREGREDIQATVVPRAQQARAKQGGLMARARAQRDSLEVERAKPKPPPSVEASADATDTSRARPRQRTAQGQINKSLRALVQPRPVGGASATMTEETKRTGGIGNAVKKAAARARSVQESSFNKKTTNHSGVAEEHITDEPGLTRLQGLAARMRTRGRDTDKGGDVDLSNRRQPKFLRKGAK